MFENINRWATVGNAITYFSREMMKGYGVKLNRIKEESG
jgi:hypothetical protein